MTPMGPPAKPERLKFRITSGLHPRTCKIEVQEGDGPWKHLPGVVDAKVEFPLDETVKITLRIHPKSVELLMEAPNVVIVKDSGSFGVPIGQKAAGHCENCGVDKKGSFGACYACGWI